MVKADDIPLQRTLRIGKVTVGLVGLDVALAKVLNAADMEEEAAVEALLAAVARQNYIPASATDMYRQALKQEYLRLRQGKPVQNRHLDIRILGPGCVSCNRLNTLIFDIMQEMGIAADILQIHDLDEIWRQGVTKTPALLINGEVMCSGRLPSRSKVEKWLRDAWSG